MEKIHRKRTPLALFLVLLLGLGSGSSARAQEERPTLLIEISVQKEVIVFKEGKEVIEYVPVDKVQSDDILVYNITYTNVGENDAQNASVVDPIPDGTTYVMDSTGGEGADILYSIDGGFSYHRPPVTYEGTKADGSVEEIMAPAAMYTHIKWVIGKIIAPGMSGLLSFKVKVK